MRDRARTQDTRSCESIRPLLGAFLDGELDDGLAAEVQEHVRNCRACSVELDALRQIDGQAQRWLAVEPPSGFSADLKGTVRAAVRRQAGDEAARSRVRVPPGVRFGLALALSAVLFVGVAYFSVDLWRQGAVRHPEIEEQVVRRNKSVSNTRATETPAGEAGSVGGVKGERKIAAAERVYSLAAKQVESSAQEENVVPAKLPSAQKRAARRPASVAETGTRANRRMASPEPEMPRAEKAARGVYAGESAVRRENPGGTPRRAIQPLAIGPPARHPLRTAALDSLERMASPTFNKPDPVDLVSRALRSEEPELQRLGSRASVELARRLKIQPDAALARRLLTVVHMNRETLARWLGKARVGSVEKTLELVLKRATKTTVEPENKVP